MLHLNRFFINYLVVILFLICSFCHAQPQIYTGLKVGLNKSQILNDDHLGYNKTGFNGGLFIQLKIAKKWTSQFETLCSFKGCQNKHQSNYVVDPYLVSLYYFDFPLLFQYHQKKITYELGLGIGYLREQRELILLKGITNDFTNRFSRTEQSGIIGIAYTFNNNNNLGLDFRYSNSILPVRKATTKQYNSLFTLSLTYKTDFKKKKNAEEL
ncbi:MAG: outer membrane beta-barrel protein [Bacteroidia bacterium]